MKNLIIIFLFFAFKMIYTQDFLQERSALKFAEEGQYEKAIEIYNKMIEESGEDPEWLYNLGTLHLLQKNYDESIKSLNKAAVTEDNELRENIFYNIGNSHYLKEEYGQAVNAYKKALKLNYQNRFARENLELSLREQQKQEEQQKSEQDKNIEPSDFARKLKEKAEELALKRLYRDAYNLMMSGLQKDPTVQAYQNFISRLNVVAEIEG